LADTGVHGNAGEITFAQQLVEFRGTKGALDEDDDLVEFQGVQQVVELPILLRLVQLYVELLKAVKSELRLVVNVDLKRILHELLADWSNFL